MVRGQLRGLRGGQEAPPGRRLPDPQADQVPEVRPLTVAPEILGREVGHAGYITVERMRIRLPDGAEVVREVENHGNGVGVLPFDAARRTALVVRQFRLPAWDLERTPWLEEACAGMMEAETAEDTARREADEELGVRLSQVEWVGRVWASPGVSTERLSLFLAPYGPDDRLHAGGGAADENEGITVVERPLAELAADADAGRILDAKLLILVSALRLRRPALFA